MTAALVFSLTLALPFKTRETVAVETFASFEISYIFILFCCRYSGIRLLNFFVYIALVNIGYAGADKGWEVSVS